MLREAAEIAKAEGYDVEKVKKTRMGESDFFGCGDLLLSRYDTFKVVGVTSRKNAARVRNRMKDFANHPPGIKKEVWSYDLRHPPKDPKRWKREEILYSRIVSVEVKKVV